MTNNLATAAVLPVWTVSDRLAKARETIGLTQEQMAGRIGVDRRSISKYETVGRPRMTVVLAYSQVTGVPVWWLEGGGDDPEKNEMSVTQYKRALVIALPQAA